MTFVLTVDAHKFRAHVSGLISEVKDHGHAVVPVIKGTGYGLSSSVLYNEAQLLEIARIAIGTVWELADALKQFPGEILVLEPLSSLDQEAYELWNRCLTENSERIICTMSTPEVSIINELGISRIFLEGRTSLNRFGLTPDEFTQTISELPSHVRVEGLLLHLPIAESKLSAEHTANENERTTTDKLATCHEWLEIYRNVAESRGFAKHVSVSHVSLNDLNKLGKRFEDFDLDLRLGTKLWLGDLSALKALGTVLAIHDISANRSIGYQQRRVGFASRVAVISGGTSHGVALSAPTTATTLRKKLIAIAEGFGQAMGKVRSPFILNNKNLLFVEPPHMHVSMVWLPRDSALKVGDMVECTIRQTTAAVDKVLGLD